MFLTRIKMLEQEVSTKDEEKYEIIYLLLDNAIYKNSYIKNNLANFTEENYYQEAWNILLNKNTDDNLLNIADIQMNYNSIEKLKNSILLDILNFERNKSRTVKFETSYK